MVHISSALAKEPKVNVNMRLLKYQPEVSLRVTNSSCPVSIFDTAATKKGYFSALDLLENAALFK